MKVKLKNFDTDLPEYQICRQLADADRCKSISIKQLVDIANYTSEEAHNIIYKLSDLELLFINDEDYPRADPWEESYFFVKSLENIGLMTNQEYLVLVEGNNYFSLITDNLATPYSYAKGLFNITDSTKGDLWVIDEKLNCQYPQELAAPFSMEAYFDGDLESRYIYFKYLKKIGLLLPDAKEIIDPRREKARAERVAKQVEKLQLRDQNKSKYHFLAWLESKNIHLEQSTDEQIIEVVKQILKEIRQDS